MRGLLARNLTIGLLFPLGLGIACASSAMAQGIGDGPTSMGSASQRMMRGTKQSAAGKPVVAPPPVLPGSKVSPEAAAPTASLADMSPTEALFDSINRGDIGSARDAVNRGADLSSRNVLGLTPLELSVDLGHNDISFLLLSMREADSPSRAPVRAEPARRGVAQVDSDAPAAMFRASSNSRPRVVAVATRAPAEPVSESPRVFSGDGGAPIPAAGFVGFGGR